MAAGSREATYPQPVIGSVPRGRLGSGTSCRPCRGARWQGAGRTGSGGDRGLWSYGSSACRGCARDGRRDDRSGTGRLSQDGVGAYHRRRNHGRRREERERRRRRDGSRWSSRVAHGPEGVVDGLSRIEATCEVSRAPQDLGEHHHPVGGRIAHYRSACLLHERRETRVVLWVSKAGFARGSSEPFLEQTGQSRSGRGQPYELRRCEALGRTGRR
jgi:hypothetical protein